MMSLGLVGDVGGKPHLNIDSFFSIRPSQDTVGFASQIATFGEFRKYGATMNERQPGKYKFFSYQEMISIFMQRYNRLFLISDPGVGKTHMVIATAERFRKQYKELGMAAPIHKFYIIVSGPTIARQVTSMIIESSPDFQDMPYASAEKLVNDFYRIVRFGQFVGEVYQNKQQELLPVDEIKKRFVNTGFYIDEVQYLRTESGAVGIGAVTERKEELAKFTDVELETKEARDTDRRYKAAEYVYEHAPDSVFMIGSATPAVNNISQIFRAANIILPRHRKFTEEEIKEYQTLALAGKIDTMKIALKMEGYVSYVKQVSADAMMEQYGNVMLQDGVIKSFVKFESGSFDLPVRFLLATDAKGIQLAVVKNLYQKAKGGTGSILYQQASLCVFPDGSYDGEVNMKESDVKHVTSGLGLYIKYIFDVNERRNGGKEYMPTQLFDEWLPKGLEFDQYIKILEQNSAIYASLLKEIRAAWDEGDKKRGLRGTFYIYCRFVNAGGAILLGQLLERILGFEPFTGDRYVSGPETEGKKIRRARTTGAPIKLADGKRYTIIKHDPTGTRNTEKLRLVNSPENVNGNKCFIIIGTPVSGVGLNLKHVKRVRLATADSSEAGSIQIINRAFRTNAYQEMKEFINNLSDEQKRKLGVQDIRNYKIVIQVGFMITTFLKEGSDRDRTSLSLQIYVDALKEGGPIASLMNNMRRTSVDAYINYDRNRILPYDRRIGDDEQKQVDFYNTVMNEKITPIDWTVYQTDYATEEISAIVERIKSYFRTYHALDLFSIKSRLEKTLGPISGIILERALAQLISEAERNDTVQDSLGRYLQIYENGDIYYLSDAVTPSDAALNELNRNMYLLAQSNTTFINWLDEQEEIKSEQTVKLFIDEKKDFITSNIELSMHSRIKLIEDAIVKKISGKPVSKFEDWLLERYSFYIHKFIDPRVAGRRVIVHRMDALILPVSKAGQDIRVSKVDYKKTKIRVYETQVRRTDSSGETGIWRDMIKSDGDIRRAIEADIDYQVDYMCNTLPMVGGQHMIMSEIVRHDGSSDYRRHIITRNEKKQGPKWKIERGKLIIRLPLKELQYMVADMKIPAATQEQPLGYYRTYTNLTDDPSRAMAPVSSVSGFALKDIVSGTLRKNFPERYEQISMTNEETVLVYYNLSHSGSRNTGATLSKLIITVMRTKGYLLRRADPDPSNNPLL